MSDAFVTQTRDAMVTAIPQLPSYLAIAAAIGELPAPLPPPPLVPLYDSRFTLNDVVGGRLVLMPNDKRLDLLTRGDNRLHDVMIDVAVQYKFGNPTPAELDPWMNLAEGMLGDFIGVQLSNNFTCVAGEFRHLFIPEFIEKFRAFCSVLTFTFRAGT